MRRAHRIAIVLATVAFGASATSDAFARDRSNEGAVVIRASGATLDGIGEGTIVAVSGSTVRILTAKHVATYGPLTILFEDGTRASAHVLETMPDRDLAIVEADVAPDFARSVHAAAIAAPLEADPIHLWGNGRDDKAPMVAAVGIPGADLPDGAAKGRFAFACSRCHEGNSGAGLFDADGHLVGVYVGYFGTASSDRISIAENPLVAERIVRDRPYPTTLASSP